MNRLQFLKEMKDSLFTTVKSVYEPLVEDDLQKLSRSADKMLGIKWVLLAGRADEMADLEQRQIEGQPIICVKEGNSIRAYSGICPACTNLLVLSSFEKNCKCLMCEENYPLFPEDHTSVTGLKEFDVQRKETGYFIGIHRQK
ncbi:hypothetical protein [Bacillus sp. 1P06AnD]|uniref:hypothetical protein n=1 Tax=Bacillus sp. 1P06AnD TaxID=3132208 RepID=UPI0039A3C9EA